MITSNPITVTLSSITGGITECNTKKCAITNNYVTLYDNPWGLGTTETWQFKLYYYNNNYKFGWEWERLNPQKHTSGTYQPVCPSAVLRQPSWTTARKATKISQINSMILELRRRYILKPTSTDHLNFNWDIFITNGVKRRVEIMIWPDYQGVWGGNPNKTFNDGFNTYQISQYQYGSNPPTDFLAYVRVGGNNIDANNTTFKADLKKILDNVKTRGVTIENNWRIDALVVSSEIWKSKGKLEIDTFKVKMNDIDYGLIT